jgi:hypothetical protein
MHQLEMEYVATFDYIGMGATVKMSAIPEGWRITMEARTPARKYSHFVIPLSGGGSSIDVPPGSITSVNIAESQTLVYWRIQSLGEIMQNYKLYFDFSGPMPKLKLECGLQAPMKPETYVEILSYSFKDNVQANFKLYKSGGAMKVKKV